MFLVTNENMGLCLYIHTYIPLNVELLFFQSLFVTKQRVLSRTCMNNFVNKKEMMSTIKFALFNLTNWFHQIQHIKWEPLKFNLFWSKIKHGVLNLNFIFLNGPAAHLRAGFSGPFWFVFWPSNRCSACFLLVKIIFSPSPHLLPFKK